MELERLLRQGAAHIAAMQYDEARKSFKAAYDIAPASANAANGLGISLHELGELPDAVRFLLKAVQLAPEFLLPLINLGLAYLELDDLDAAIECFEKVLSKDPKDSEVVASALAWAATTLERKGKLVHVEEYFDRAGQLSGTFRAAKMLRFSEAFLSEMVALKSPNLPTQELVRPPPTTSLMLLRL